MALVRVESGKPLPPPLYYLLAPGDLRKGQTNLAWYAQAGSVHLAGRSEPMIVKWLPEQHKLATEIACALAAQALGCPVPGCALVVADRDQLTGIPASVVGDRLLLFGSVFVEPDRFLAEVMDGQDAIEDAVWTRVCGSQTGPRGAALDELLANPDRHIGNVLFDGKAWWLIDHDLALQPASEWARDWANQETRRHAVEFSARVNQLASHMLRLMPTQRDWLLRQPSTFERQKRQLAGLAAWVGGWRDTDSRIEGIWQLTGLMLDLIATRLPALAQHLSNRSPDKSAAALTWTSPAPPR